MNGSCVLQDIDDREVFTPEYWHIKLDEARDYTLLILHLLVIFTGMPLNVLVITKILTEQLYPQPTYLLLLNLAVCDLLVCLVPVLINIISGFRGTYSFGDSDYTRCQMCKLGVIYIILNFQTLFTLTLISLDRLAYFRLSIKYHRIVRIERISIALAVTWVISFLFGIPPLAGYGDIVFSTMCGMIFVNPVIHVSRSIPYIIVGFITYVTCMFVLVLANIWVICIGLKQIQSLRVKPVPKMTGNYFERRMSIIDIHATVRQFKIFQVFGGILVVHFVTLIPAIVLVCIRLFSGYMSQTLYSFVLFSLIAQASLHPLVEAFFTPELKKIITKCFKVCKRRKKKIFDEVSSQA